MTTPENGAAKAAEARPALHTSHPSCCTPSGNVMGQGSENTEQRTRGQSWGRASCGPWTSSSRPGPGGTPSPAQPLHSSSQAGGPHTEPPRTEPHTEQRGVLSQGLESKVQGCIHAAPKPTGVHSLIESNQSHVPEASPHRLLPMCS